MKRWEIAAILISIVCIVLGIYFYTASYNPDLHYVYNEATGVKVLVNLPHPEWRPTAVFWICAGIGIAIFTMIWHNLNVQSQKQQMETALGWKYLNDRA